MKTLNIIFLFLLASSLVAQNYPQAYGYGGSASDYGLHVKVDDNGNVYTIGGYENSIDFDGNILTANGNPALGMFIIKHNAHGDLQWAFNGGTDGEELFYLGLDAQSNVYVSGSFIGTQTYGDSTFTTDPNESNDNFIFKINSDGTFAWAKHIRGPDHEHIQGMAVSASGEIYVSAFFDATFTYEGTTLTNNGSSDIFIMKFDSDGNFMWGKANGSTGSDWPWDLDVDGSGNIYLVARYEAAFDWDGTPLSHFDGRDMLVVKMNGSDGTTQFSKTFGGPGSDEPRGIVSDDEGNCYVTGYFATSIDFGLEEIITDGSIDGIVFKLSPNGNFRWAQKFGGIATDTRIIPPAIDIQNSVYVGGSLNGDLQVNGQTLTNAGSRDAYVIKYNTDGIFKSALIHGNTGSDNMGGIHVNDSGKVWITGRFASSLIEFGPSTLTNNGIATSDIFLAEISDWAAVPFPDGLSETGLHKSWKLYPNPAIDNVFIENPGGKIDRVMVYHLSGQLVSSQTLNESASIQVRDLTPGTYVIKAYFKDGHSVSRQLLLKQ